MEKLYKKGEQELNPAPLADDGAGEGAGDGDGDDEGGVVNQIQRCW